MIADHDQYTKDLPLSDIIERPKFEHVCLSVLSCASPSSHLYQTQVLPYSSSLAHSPSMLCETKMMLLDRETNSVQVGDVDVSVDVILSNFSVLYFQSYILNSKVHIFRLQSSPSSLSSSQSWKHPLRIEKLQFRCLLEATRGQIFSSGKLSQIRAGATSFRKPSRRTLGSPFGSQTLLSS